MIDIIANYAIQVKMVMNTSFTLKSQSMNQISILATHEAKTFIEKIIAMKKKFYPVANFFN